MTYGPQPGWNPNQPPVGPPPGYPQPGMHPMNQPGPGPQSGQPPTGQFGPPGSAPAGPQSPLRVIAGALALVSFAYTAFVAITLLTMDLSRIPYSAASKFFFVPWQTRHATWFYIGAIGLVAILFLIGGLLLVTRKSSGRVLVVIGSVCTIAIIASVPIAVHGIYALNTFSYVFAVLVLVLLVLCLLPATRHGGPTAYAPPQQFAPQQPYGAQYQQPGYPQQQPPGNYQQQPPGGYQQPPGGMPS